MKLLAQSDDFGITVAVSYGIVHAIENGIIRNTGLFSNMPWSKECVEMIIPYLDRISLGIDLNMVAGSPVSDPKDVPTLVQSNGNFLTSRMNRELDNDQNKHDHVNYGEVYKEFEAQIDRFIVLVGRKPDYIHGHAYGTETTNKISEELAVKYDIPLSTQIMHRANVKTPLMNWYINPPTLENQIKSDLCDYIISNNDLLNSEIVYLITHCGYVDARLFDLSSFTLYRLKDFEAMTSSKIKEWIKDNNIELINYSDLQRGD